MWKEAIESAMETVKRNATNHPGLFPHISNELRYDWGQNNDWIDGFFTGLLWLSYEYSGDESYKQLATEQLKSFKHRLENHIVMDHHDIGFLYSLSAVAEWRVTGNVEARELALLAADKLMHRYRDGFGAIQAWGMENDPENGGRIIIDCLMNLPLLHWAYQETGDSRYYEIAEKHAQKSLRFLVRGDGSSYHTFYFDQIQGNALRGGTHQGYEDGSTWSRGQSWGVFGFALSYRYTRKEVYLDTAKRMARYFIEHLPEDNVSYWDFDVDIEPDTPRDSSATAITACGILEILDLMTPDDPEREYLNDALHRMMRSLVEKYSTRHLKEAEGLIQHGSYHVRGGQAPDNYMIWGDYYYLEALVRMDKGIKGYW